MEVGESVPAFLRKLWKIVENPETDNMIHWSVEGKSFIVVNAVELVKVMPIWYKHGNMASFVRQLNMYGFRKVSSLDNGMNSANIMEYAHPNFLRACPWLLENISRRLAVTRKHAQGGGGEVSVVMSRLQEASSSQETLASQLELMRAKHVQLVNELDALRKAALRRVQHPPDSGANAKPCNSAKASAGGSTRITTSIDNTVTVTSGNAELGRLLAKEARVRLEMVDQQRKSMLREHWLRMRELELRVSAEKARAEREASEWSLRMKGRDQKLANLRLRNDVLREELRSLPH